MSERTAKNVKKGLSYAWAFARMGVAFDQEFYLECICFAESIISDRVLSYLQAPHLKGTVTPHSEKTTLGVLLDSWKKIHGISRNWRDVTDLYAAVNQWSKDRNRAVHSAAKSPPGRPTKLPAVFRTEARKVAKEGKKLAHYMAGWHRKTKREQERG